jgi:monooxygenase
VTAEHLDVLVVGAGISGIGVAYQLQRDHPQRSVALLEARGALGGTWDLFRYPGVRSDSDLHTLGFEFAPWHDDQSIADADRILGYLRATAAEHGIDRRVRFHHQVLGAAWSSAEARWTVDVRRTDTGERTTLTCDWLVSAAGYYRYDAGFTPRFPGRERFRGPVVHPQHWPEDLDTAGRRVLVIGSGATAVTLVPALADTAAHVTMLQRTPSYVLPVRRQDPIARRLRALLGEDRAYPLIRRKDIAVQRAVWAFCRRYPASARRLIRRVTARQLPAGYEVDVHFNPPYDPWSQRLCVAPDGDLFRAIRTGRATVVTDRIATFTERGVLLESGRELEADLVVTATGLALQAFGGIALTVDGVPVHLPERLVYKGMMLSGVPDFAFAIGYTHASWTLKVGLVAEHLSRLLAHMDAHGYDVCRPEVVGPPGPTTPLLDLTAGYVRRADGELPRQGSRMPWRTGTDPTADAEVLRTGSVPDPELTFGRLRVPGGRPAGSVPGDPDRLPLLGRVGRAVPGEPGALDVQGGQPAQGAGEPPGPPAEQRQRRRDEHHADHERVEQDAGGQREGDRLDGRVPGGHEPGEHREHDQRGRDDDRSRLAEARADRVQRAGAVAVRLVHARHQEDLVVHRQPEQDADHQDRREADQRPGALEVHHGAQPAPLEDGHRGTERGADGEQEAQHADQRHQQ